jgi:NitT/TauT family transport system substrate-binding protein
MKPDELGDALRARRIDAVSISEPYIGGFQKEFGVNAVTFYGETSYLATWVVTSRKEFVAERPETVKRLVRSLLKAQAFARRSPAETADIVARSVGMKRADCEISLPSFDFRVKLDQALLINMENQARWAIRRKLTDRTEVPNFLDYIYLDGLRVLRPEAVTIIHRAPP